MQKQKLLDNSLNEAKTLFESFGIKKFRASQIYDAIYQGKSLQDIKNIPQNDLKMIDEHFIVDIAKICKIQKSSDGTIKFAIKLADESIIETVLMSYTYGKTLCISTQVGCRMGCKFCASTIGGLVRNMSAGEILAQAIVVNAYLGGSKNNRQITNIVLMGCGEPLDNYEEVTKFIKLVEDKDFLNISQRNISLSTCGIAPNIYKLADDGFKINLTISLHASNDEDRKKIMPIARKYSINEVLKACDYYFAHNNRRIYFEYTLVKGVNDSEKHIMELKNLLKSKVCHVNVIVLNEVAERSVKGVSRKQAQKFVDKLNSVGISATLRRTLGQDIDGACGQLRKRLGEND